MRRRVHRQSFGWLCRRGGMRLRALTRTVQQYAAMSCGGEYIENLLDGFVGAVVCGFELAIWTVVRIRAVVEAVLAIGPQSRLWKNRNSRATWTPFVVRR